MQVDHRNRWRSFAVGSIDKIRLKRSTLPKAYGMNPMLLTPNPPSAADPDPNDFKSRS
jgi:hypothetical protein